MVKKYFSLKIKKKNILPIHICKCYIIDAEKELEYSSILKIFKDPEGNMLYGIIELPVIVGNYFNLLYLNTKVF